MTFIASISTAKGIEVERDGEKVKVFRINAGCGTSLYRDCANVDKSSDVGADFVFDLNGKFPFDDDTFDSVFCSHTLEHLHNPLAFMQELHRVCVHGAVAIFKTPYGSSDNAWEDPTHTRPYFLDSFGYFSQAAYGGTDYGYRGDWTPIERELRIVPGHGLESYRDKLEDLLAIVMTQRNIVEEMKVIVRAVKPIRPAGGFKEGCSVSFVFHQPKAVVDNPSEVPS